MTPGYPLALSLAVSMAVLGSALPAQARQDDPSLFNRQARGELSEYGGARRVEQDLTQALKQSLSKKKAKNVILLIGDGMGDSEITVARNYARGAGGYFKGIDALPLTGQYTHYSLHKDSGLPDYVTDSAASATAWTTGSSRTTARSAWISRTAAPQPAGAGQAQRQGHRNVSTAELQDATPAALLAHVTARKCYGPEATSKQCPSNALENGGAGSITEQWLKTRPDVVLGGGAATFAETAKAGRYAGKTLRAQAEARGYRIVENLDELKAVRRANQKQPLIGLFAPGNMPVRWLGPTATYHGNLNQPAVSCEANPKRTADIPTLAQMTSKAIELLKDNPNGFFLQVEGASIDKQDHAANPCGQIGETVDLDEAVQKALAFAKADGETLVIVTADHAHSSQIIPPETAAPGLTQLLTTKDGAPLAISYGNSEEGSQEHTGTQLRIAAYGPQAANVTGLTDQTDLFFTIRRALNLRD
ncbi:alkaline phosphatase [Pseudomonas aeruginosa]|nr:alkaline phosphatase [Pseudomonas aeruginosa]